MRRTKMKKLLKLSVSFLIVIVLLLSTGIAVNSAANGQDKSPLNQNARQSKGSINISNDTKELIRLSDKKNYESNITKYTELLVQFNVHEKYISEIERLLTENHKLPDILTAYSFLNDRFGLLQEIETLIQEKETGKSWTVIFKEYNKKNPEFIPRSFESGYLEELMKTPGITADDIMLADRVSQKSGKTMQEVMENRMVGDTWKDINAWLDIVNGDEVLLRISVSPEQIDKYVNSGMDREVVVQGFVIAKKMSQDVNIVMKELKAGTRVEELLDKFYTQKYY